MDSRAAGEVTGRLLSSGWTAESLYRLEYPRLVRLAGLILADFEAGEDIAQDAFARLLNARGGVADPASYLRVSVVNLSRSRIRRAAVARQPRRRLLVAPSAADDLAEQSATHDIVLKALRRLSLRQRQAVVLRYYEDMTDAEVAATIGISIGSVKVHLRRALDALAGGLDELRNPG